jgi:hypothetical protein
VKVVSSNDYKRAKNKPTLHEIFTLRPWRGRVDVTNVTELEKALDLENRIPKLFVDSMFFNG